MTLFAWLAGRVWSAWHILHLGLPLCGTPVPDVVARMTMRAARPSDWFRICSKCKELAVRGATEAPAIDLMAALVASLKTEAADRGEAVDGPNGRMATTGAIRPEDTALVENGQTP